MSFKVGDQVKMAFGPYSNIKGQIGTVVKVKENHLDYVEVSFLGDSNIYYCKEEEIYLASKKLKRTYTFGNVTPTVATTTNVKKGKVVVEVYKLKEAGTKADKENLEKRTDLVFSTKESLDKFIARLMVCREDME